MTPPPKPDIIEPTSINHFEGVPNTDYQKALDAKLKQGNEQAQAFYAKHVPKGGAVGDYKSSHAFYDPNTNSISMDLKEDATNKRGVATAWFHEHGHYVDNKLGRRSQSKEYLDALKADVKAYEKKIKTELNKGDMAFSLSEVRHRIGGEFKKEGNLTHSIQDIFGGAIKKPYPGAKWGHDARYWKSHGDAGVGLEAFAHMFEASFSKEKQQYFEKYLPKSWNLFQKFIEDK